MFDHMLHRSTAQNKESLPDIQINKIIIDIYCCEHTSHYTVKPSVIGEILPD